MQSVGAGKGTIVLAVGPCCSHDITSPVLVSLNWWLLVSFYRGRKFWGYTEAC